MSKPIYFTDAAAKLAFEATQEAQAIKAGFSAAYADPNASPTQCAERLKEALKPFADEVLETYCRYRLAGNGNVQRVRGLDLTKEPKTWPASVSAGSQVAPSKAKTNSTKPKAKPKEAVRDESWKLGNFDSEYGQKRIAVFLRRRKCSLASQDEADAIQRLAQEVKADYAKNQRKKPSFDVLESIGKAQLPPAAIEWLLRFGYGFGKDDAEVLEEAQIACAYAVLKQRYIYLPDSGEAYRVEDRKAVKESSAIGEMQKWFGDGVGDHVIRRALRTHCPQATGKVRVPGRDVRFLQDGRWVVNEWAPPPWPEVNASDADVKPFTDLVRYQAGDEAEVVFDWMAAHVQAQHWHKHQRWGLILISDYQQTGREAMLNIFSRALGVQNRTNGMLAELEKGPELAAYLARGSLVVFSEAHVGFQQLERLKEVMGSERALVRTMNRNAEYMYHASTIAILSNDPQCVKLSADNQRFFVIRNTKPRMDHNTDGTKKKPGEPGFSAYDDLRKWEDDGGPAKLLSWLRRRDLSNHNFETRPYATAAELELIDSALSPVITDIKEMVVARKGPFAAELIEVSEARREISAGVDMPGGQRFQKEVADYEIRHALKAAGGVPLGQARVRSTITRGIGKAAKKETLDRERVSLWALGNADKWKGLKSEESAPILRGLGLQCQNFALAEAKAKEAAAAGVGTGEPDGGDNVTPIAQGRRTFQPV